MSKTVTLHPSRIGCPSIPGTMKGIIVSTPGVEKVDVRYEDRSLDVTFREEETSPEEIIRRIGEEMGIAMEVAEPNSRKEGDVSHTCPM